jgi:hypothetical protein
LLLGLTLQRRRTAQDNQAGEQPEKVASESPSQTVEIDCFILHVERL